jgi:vacuolar-type H+-ATPase subunit F/Vma7
MGRIAVLGDPSRVEYYQLSGALVLAAETPEGIVSAWNSLPSDVDLIVLTPRAAAELAKHSHAERSNALTVTLP